ncbi:MAG: nuclear transport factor 2 family protein [Cyclobacteriaceae bacterium]
MAKRILVLLAFVVSIAANSQVVDRHSNDLWKITRDYLQAFEQMDFDKMGTFLHDSVEFFDIGSHAEGKKNVVEVWKKTFTPLPLRIQFDIREHFVSGSFVVLDMRYEVVNVVEGKNVLLNIEVISVLQFRDGKIILLHDYPDFTAYGRQLASQLKGKKAKSNEVSERNVSTTLGYYEAYSRWDVASMSTFFHDSIEFKDLTAKDMFKGGKFEHLGKEAVSKFWSGIFGDQRLSYVDMVVNNAFTAGDYVVVNTTLSLVLPPSWTGNAPGKVLVSLPIKSLLRFRDGKIIRQYDFADYTVYNKQIKVQLEK